MNSKNSIDKLDRPFKISIEEYEKAFRRSVASWSPQWMDEFPRLPHDIGRVDRLFGDGLQTFITSGLGAFPLYDELARGWVSRELAFTTNQATSGSAACGFIDMIVADLLDHQSVPPDGAECEWPAPTRFITGRRDARSIFLGRFLLDETQRRIAIGGLPVTTILEVVPLLPEEIDALGTTAGPLASCLASLGIDATDMGRRTAVEN